jgi:hypothetical protein
MYQNILIQSCPHVDFLKRKQEVQTKKILKRTSGITCQYFRNINHINRSIFYDGWVLNNKQLLIQGTSLWCGCGYLYKCKIVDAQVLAKSIKWQSEEIKHKTNWCTNNNQQYLLHLKNLLAETSGRGVPFFDLIHRCHHLCWEYTNGTTNPLWLYGYTA